MGRWAVAGRGPWAVGRWAFGPPGHWAIMVGRGPAFSKTPASTAPQTLKALILPHFDYCNSVWDKLNVTLSDNL